MQRVAYWFIVRTWYSPAGPLKVSKTAYVRKDLGKARTEKTVSSGFQETDGFTGRRSVRREAGYSLAVRLFPVTEAGLGDMGFIPLLWLT